MGLMKRASLSVLAGAVVGLTSMWADAPPARADDIVLRMAVPDWPPTRIMKDLANKNYKAPSGNHVTLEADFIPWPNYYERLAASLTSGEKKYQMAVSDSQWLGAFIEGGYYMKLDKFIDADPELQAIFKDLHPNLVNAYSTYPYKSDNHYGFPQMPDVLVSYYRKDVFCDDERAGRLQGQVRLEAALHAGRDGQHRLDDVQGLRRVLPAQGKGDKLAGQASTDDFYGIAFQAGKGYDFVVHADQRLHLAGWRRHLGRDQGAQRPGRGCGELRPRRSRRSITICR